MYVAVKGGEQAIAAAHRWLAEERRGEPATPELSVAQIEQQLKIACDRVMNEGSLYDRPLAALAIKQAQGDLIEAAFLLRAYRTTLPRFGYSEPLDTARMAIRRRISATYKDLPGGQVLGPTFDYTHRLLDFRLAAEGEVEPAPERPSTVDEAVPRVVDILDHEGLIQAEPGDPPRRPGRRSDPRAAAVPGRTRRAPAEPRARRRGFSSGPRLLHPARLRQQPSVRRRDPGRRGDRRTGARGARLPDRARRDRGHRVPAGQPVQGLQDRAAAVLARLWPGVRPQRAQGDGDGAGRPRAARRGDGRGDRRRPPRTRSSCSITRTTSRRPASSST